MTREGVTRISRILGIHNRVDSDINGACRLCLLMEKYDGI